MVKYEIIKIKQERNMLKTIEKCSKQNKKYKGNIIVTCEYLETG